jgi:hypothetical protein
MPINLVMAALCWQQQHQHGVFSPREQDDIRLRMTHPSVPRPRRSCVQRAGGRSGVGRVMEPNLLFARIAARSISPMHFLPPRTLSHELPRTGSGAEPKVLEQLDKVARIMLDLLSLTTSLHANGCGGGIVAPGGADGCGGGIVAPGADGCGGVVAGPGTDSNGAVSLADWHKTDDPWGAYLVDHHPPQGHTVCAHHVPCVRARSCPVRARLMLSCAVGRDRCMCPMVRGARTSMLARAARPAGKSSCLTARIRALRRRTLCLSAFRTVRGIHGQCI